MNWTSFREDKRVWINMDIYQLVYLSKAGDETWAVFGLEKDKYQGERISEIFKTEAEAMYCMRKALNEMSE